MGLAFVHAVATAHGGTAHVDDAGQGTSVTLRMPTARESEPAYRDAQDHVAAPAPDRPRTDGQAPPWRSGLLDDRQSFYNT